MHPSERNQGPRNITAQLSYAQKNLMAEVAIICINNSGDNTIQRVPDRRLCPVCKKDGKNIICIAGKNREGKFTGCKHVLCRQCGNRFCLNCLGILGENQGVEYNGTFTSAYGGKKKKLGKCAHEFTKCGKSRAKSQIDARLLMLGIPTGGIKLRGKGEKKKKKNPFAMFEDVGEKYSMFEEVEDLKDFSVFKEL